MEFNTTTFILEIVNFIVLVWLLKRLLIKPIRQMIAKRQEAMRQQVEQAEQSKRQANELKQACEQQQQKWQEERSKRLQSLDAELEKRRQQGEAKLKQEWEQELTKLRVRAQKDIEQQRSQLDLDAKKRGRAFTKAFLQRLAGTELDQLLVQMTLDDLTTIEDSLKQKMLDSFQATDTVQICSAHPLPQSVQQKLEKTLTAIFKGPKNFQIKSDPELISGLLINLGTYQIKANVSDELGFFFNHAHTE